MCRSIKPLYNFEPAATEDEIHAAAQQFVRKVSGYREPSAVNKQVFDAAVISVTKSINILFNSLETKAAPRNREVEADKARKRAAGRY